MTTALTPEVTMAYLAYLGCGIPAKTAIHVTRRRADLRKMRASDRSVLVVYVLGPSSAGKVRPAFFVHGQARLLTRRIVVAAASPYWKAVRRRCHADDGDWQRCKHCRDQRRRKVPCAPRGARGAAGGAFAEPRRACGRRPHRVRVRLVGPNVVCARGEAA